MEELTITPIICKFCGSKAKEPVIPEFEERTFIREKPSEPIPRARIFRDVGLGKRRF